MLLELIATFCTALFAGAALYVNLVEHPARVELGTGAAIREWRPTYPRATLLQASPAGGGLIAAVGAWIHVRGTPALIAILTLGFVVPFTFVIIYLTNRRLS